MIVGGKAVIGILIVLFLSVSAQNAYIETSSLGLDPISREHCSISETHHPDLVSEGNVRVGVMGRSLSTPFQSIDNSTYILTGYEYLFIFTGYDDRIPMGAYRVRYHFGDGYSTNPMGPSAFAHHIYNTTGNMTLRVDFLNFSDNSTIFSVDNPHPVTVLDEIEIDAWIEINGTKSDSTYQCDFVSNYRCLIVTLNGTLGNEPLKKTFLSIETIDNISASVYTDVTKLSSTSWIINFSVLPYSSYYFYEDELEYDPIQTYNISISIKDFFNQEDEVFQVVTIDFDAVLSSLATDETSSIDWVVTFSAIATLMLITFVKKSRRDKI